MCAKTGKKKIFAMRQTSLSTCYLKFAGKSTSSPDERGNFT
jgi:hypothetical protein